MRLHGKIFSYLLMLMTYFFAVSAFAKDLLPLEPVCHSLTATGNSEYPPFLWRESNDDNHLLGANRLILDEISHRIGIPIRLIHVGSWSQAQTEVKNGRVDIMAGAFYTNERANYMDYFSPVMLYTSSVVWQRKKNRFTFSRREDLEQKWGATVINNSFGQEFDQYAQDHLNVLVVASLSKAFHMLVDDRVDYVLYEKNPGMAYLSMLGLADLVQPVQPYISSEGLYLTLSKKSVCNNMEVKQKIAQALRDMKQQGFTEKALMEGLQEWRAYHAAALPNE